MKLCPLVFVSVNLLIAFQMNNKRSKTEFIFNNFNRSFSENGALFAIQYENLVAKDVQFVTVSEIVRVRGVVRKYGYYSI
jgi:hypothetical protein